MAQVNASDRKPHRILLVVAAALALAGCGEDRLTVGEASPTPSLSCPPAGYPEASSACVDQAEAAKYAENHAFRDRIEITAGDRERWRSPAAELKVALERLYAKDRKPASGAVAATAARALGVAPSEVAIKTSGYGVGVGETMVAAGEGRACVVATAGPKSVVVEVAGRTNEGGCLPSDGGH
jgi:hypothetical protein